MDSASNLIDAWPARATLRAVRGDPFAFRLVLRDADGDPIDVSLWEWRATVSTGALRLDFETLADDTGVRIWMRGDDTARLSTLRAWPFDVTCRQPSAGEGVVVLMGEMQTKARITDPLRHDPDAAPRDEELVPT